MSFIHLLKLNINVRSAVVDIDIGILHRNYLNSVPSHCEFGNNDEIKKLMLKMEEI